jgi:hypothetical protein
MPVEAAPQVVCVLHYSKLLFERQRAAQCCFYRPRGGLAPLAPHQCIFDTRTRQILHRMQLQCIFLGCIRCTGEYLIVLASSSVKPTGGLAAPLAPRHCNQRMKLRLVFLVCFCSSPANDTGANELALPGTAEHIPGPSLSASFKAKLDPER